MTCVIFGGADIEDYGSVHIPEGALVIAADGGYRHCLRLGTAPDLLIGDMDSFEGDMPDSCGIIRAPREKDETDLILAVDKGMESHCSVFHIYGADGGRMGHTLAAVQTLMYINKNGSGGILYGNGFTAMVQGEGKRSCVNDGYRYVSLFSLTDRAELTLTGLKYGGELVLERDFPLGVSNEFTGGSCGIDVKSGLVLVILEK